MWSTTDFELMGWHDSIIHGLRLISNFGTRATKWQVEVQNGDLFFEADGLEQYVRRLPIYSEGQQLSLVERGGISFEKVQATP